MVQPVSDLTVLSAMITPTVLILATGSLLLTTSQRLSRSIERARKLSERIELLAEDRARAERTAILFDQMLRAARRSRLLQQGMVCLYLALGLFVATSIAIGLIEAIHADLAWIPVALGLTGAVLLLFASGLLIFESYVALHAVTDEMAGLTQLGERHQGQLPSPKTDQ